MDLLNLLRRCTTDCHGSSSSMKGTWEKTQVPLLP